MFRAVSCMWRGSYARDMKRDVLIFVTENAASFNMEFHWVHDTYCILRDLLNSQCHSNKYEASISCVNINQSIGRVHWRRREFLSGLTPCIPKMLPLRPAWVSVVNSSLIGTNLKQFKLFEMNAFSRMLGKSPKAIFEKFEKFNIFYKHCQGFLKIFKISISVQPSYNSREKSF